MKTLITFLFSLFFLISVNYHALNYVLNQINVSTVDWVKNYDCEEENSKSEEKNEKDEKTDDTDYLYLGKAANFTLQTDFLNLKLLQLSFYLSDYCKSIDSPPKKA